MLHKKHEKYPDQWECDDPECEEVGINGNDIDGYWCDTHYYRSSIYRGFHGYAA